MKLSRTVGLAVAIALAAGTVAALAQTSGAAPADVSLVKPLPRTEQFEKRANAVPPSLSERSHGPWHGMSNGLLTLEHMQQRDK